MLGGQVFLDPDITAWVDLPSNFAWLPNVRPDDAVSMIEGRVPGRIIQTVLHETTHHWCFWTTIGEAMSLVRHRAQHGLLRLALGQDVDMLDIACDIARYEVVERALAPIIEGMALAMEHDAATRGSDTIYCRPLHHYEVLLLLEVMKEASSRLIHLVESDQKLLTVRTSEAGLRRKLNILSMPLDPAKSVYLLGYLAAKAFIVGRNRFFDGSSDKALAYLKDYFFKDYGLVTAMFGKRPDDDDPVQVAQRVCSHLVRRVETLFRGDLASGVAAWDQQDPEQPPRYQEDIDLGKGFHYPLRVTPAHGIAVRPKDEAYGYALHRELIRSLAMTGGEALLDGHQQRGLRARFTRSLMPISSTPASVFRLGDEVEARDAEGRPFGRLRPAAAFVEGSAAVLDFFSVPSESAIAAAAFVDGTVVAYAVHGSTEKDVLVHLRLLEPTPQQRDALEQSRAMHDALLKDKLGPYKGLLDHVRSQYRDIQNGIWRPAASMEIAAEVKDWKGALGLLDDTGFVRMFGGNRKVGLDVARLSLLASAPADPKELAKSFTHAGRDFEATMALVEGMRNNHGLSFIMWTNDDRVVSLI
jgi:hypothetical protein